MEVILVFLLSGILGSTYAQDFFIAAPSTLRLNSDETAAIAIDGNTTEALVDVYVQDHPEKVKNITHITVAVSPGLPKLFKFRLNVEDFPENVLKTPGSAKLVSLNVRFQNVHKEILIPISSQSGYMFIQTDRPIYTPKQSAFFRIISLTEELLPSSELFQLQIRNPDNIIVEEKSFNDKDMKLKEAFANHVYKFPTYPVFGEWSATVRFGPDLEQISTVQFELREPVLPAFTVELETPDVILPDDDRIEVRVKAQYMYGEKVKGLVSFRLGVKAEHGPTVHFGVFSFRELVNGKFNVWISTDHIRENNDVGWFPGIDKSRLEVEATVVDDVTGNRVTTFDDKALFSTTPFVISFKRCLRDFKPGLLTVFEADITYVDGRPAGGIQCELKAVSDNGQTLHVRQSPAKSDRSGRVAFEIQTETHHKAIKTTLETNDGMFREYQAKNTFEQHAVVSSSSAYIAISRTNQMRMKPGDIYARAIYYEPEDLQNIYYLVLARGRILEMKKLGSYQTLEMEVTHQMVPDFRVVVFAHHGNELIADSLKIDVDRICDPRAQVTIDLEFKEKEPNKPGKIIIRGTNETFVGLLGVDEEVYALFPNNILTKSKLFDKLSSHDIGCGPGGGVDVNAVLGNAGIALATNKYSTSQSHSCVDNKRKKRESAQEIRTGSRRRYCGNDPDLPKFLYFEEEFEFEGHITAKSDFRETWIHENVIAGSSDGEEVGVTLPHSIATWVIQAVSVSPLHGICVSEPQKLVSYKQLFVELNMPDSVVKNEHVLVQVTVYNYGHRKVWAIVFMRGVEGLYSSNQPGEKSERKRLILEPQSSSLVTFSLIPLTTGKINIKVYALSPYSSDVIEQTLYVVPEGVTKEIDFTILLDPTNQQGRKKRRIETSLYSDLKHHVTEWT